MPKYKCLNCTKYETNTKSYMYVHVCKSIRCSTNPESLKYSEDEIIKCSLINSDNLKYTNLKNEYKITKNRNEFVEELKEIYKTKRKICSHCNQDFKKYKELENHLFQCVNVSSGNTTTTNIYNIINANTININNNNINNNNINNNNININLTIQNNEDIKTHIEIIPFDKQWNTQHIDQYTKVIIFLSDFTNKYTKTLETLLQNNSNKNVFIDNESNTGIIYKNQNFENMKVKDIVDESINKLHTLLGDFSKELLESDGINKEIIKSIAKDSRYELLNYKNEKEHKINLTDLIISTFNKFKDDTKIQYIKYQEQEK
jgi:hypothetical protein